MTTHFSAQPEDTSNAPAQFVSADLFLPRHDQFEQPDMAYVSAKNG